VFACPVRWAGQAVVSPHRDDLADHIAALANSRGGTILLGVEPESGDVPGIPIDRMDDLQQFAIDIMNRVIQPEVWTALAKEWMFDFTGERRAIMRVTVPPSLLVHKSPGGYLTRLGNRNRDLPPDLLASAARRGSFISMSKLFPTPLWMT